MKVWPDPPPMMMFGEINLQQGSVLHNDLLYMRI
jgi:hypothetical protein